MQVYMYSELKNWYKKARPTTQRLVQRLVQQAAGNKTMKIRSSFFYQSY